MKHLALGAAALVLSLVLGCQSRVTPENFDRIETGMQRSEVYAILGEPAESTSISFGTLSGTAASWESDGRVITIQFLNDQVKAKQYTRSAR